MVLFIGKYWIAFVLIALLLGFNGLATPWQFSFSPQVWIAAVISAVLNLLIGLAWNDNNDKEKKPQELAPMLTQREKEVAALVLTGKSNKEICKELFIEQNTLKTHIRNIYKKVDCSTRNEFISLFKQTGPDDFFIRAR